MNAPAPPSNERQAKEQTLRLLQRMQAKLTAAEGRMSAPIAIVGMGCRFPLGDTPDALWTNLQAGRDGVATVPAERWTAAAGASGHGAFLRDIDRFDAAFFGISPREAVVMDPQQRIVLEVAWEALENAGIAADRLEATRTGVYLGCCTADYARLAMPMPRHRTATQRPAAHRASRRVASPTRSASMDRRWSSTRPARRRWSPCISPSRVYARANARWRSQAASISPCCRKARRPSTACRCCRRTVTARHSTPRPTASCAAKAAAWWC